MEDKYKNHRAKNREEYDEAVRIVQWLRARGLEARADGNENKALIIAVACNQLESRFLLPLAENEAPCPSV